MLSWCSSVEFSANVVSWLKRDVNIVLVDGGPEAFGCGCRHPKWGVRMRSLTVKGAGHLDWRCGPCRWCMADTGTSVRGCGHFY